MYAVVVNVRRQRAQILLEAKVVRRAEIDAPEVRQNAEAIIVNVIIANVEDGVLLRVVSDRLPTDHNSSIGAETDRVVGDRHIALTLDAYPSWLPQNDQRGVVDKTIVDRHVCDIRALWNLRQYKTVLECLSRYGIR